MISQIGSPDGIQIVFEVHGKGSPALIFVHGWSCDRTYWSGQIEPLSRDFTVVSIDLPGHGNSGLGRKAWTMAAYGGDVAAVVGTLGLEQVVLIGHSMGGDVILEAARRLRGQVSGLVWVDVYRQLGSPRTDEELRTSIQPFLESFVTTTDQFVRGMFPAGADPELVERIASDMSAAPCDVAIGAMEFAMSYDREVPAALRELGLPVIAINPDYRPTDRESLARYGVQAVIMPEVGHFLHMEAPERFNAILRPQIDRLVG